MVMEPYGFKWMWNHLQIIIPQVTFSARNHPWPKILLMESFNSEIKSRTFYFESDRYESDSMIAFLEQNFLHNGIDLHCILMLLRNGWFLIYMKLKFGGF